MSGRRYERIGIEAFGRQLVLSGDLDPVYIGLVRAELPPEQLARWLVAYWCFYHAGAACWLSEQERPGAYWEAMMTAAYNVSPTPVGGRWPRGAERRHFRGAQGIRAIKELEERYPRGAERMLVTLHGPGPDFSRPMPFRLLSRHIRTHRGFGHWIAFKIGDMMERVVGVPVSFEPDEALYEAPREVLSDLAEQWQVSTSEVLERLRASLADLKAPPRGDRALGLQELETILCKWGSHMSGSYPLLKDTREIHEGLAPWLPVSSLARRMSECLPRAPGGHGESASKGPGTQGA